MPACDHKGKRHRQVTQGGQRKLQCLGCMEISMVATAQQEQAWDTAIQQWGFDPPVVIP